MGLVPLIKYINIYKVGLQVEFKKKINKISLWFFMSHKKYLIVVFQLYTIGGIDYRMRKLSRLAYNFFMSHKKILTIVS